MNTENRPPFVGSSDVCEDLNNSLRKAVERYVQKDLSGPESIELFNVTSKLARCIALLGLCDQAAAGDVRAASKLLDVFRYTPDLTNAKPEDLQKLDYNNAEFFRGYAARAQLSTPIPIDISREELTQLLGDGQITPVHAKSILEFIQAREDSGINTYLKDPENATKFYVVDDPDLIEE